MSDTEYYHVETRHRDDTWHVFTEQPIEGAEAANKHLAEVKEFASQNGQDPEGVRLHRLTDKEIVATLTNEEKDEIIAEHIERVGIGPFLKTLMEHRAEARDRAYLERKIKASWFSV